MRNLRLTVSYDGTCYHGWQRQPNALTVEEAFGAAAAKILDHEVRMSAGARTDAGVHAMGQVVNFRTEKGIDCTSLRRGLNSLLPRDIRVLDAADADESFHARYSTKSKTYVYCILNRRDNSPFLVQICAPFTAFPRYGLDEGCRPGSRRGTRFLGLQEEGRGV